MASNSLKNPGILWLQKSGNPANCSIMEGHLFDGVAGPGLRDTHVQYSKSQWEGHEPKAETCKVE